jgi:hypothetical protein
VKPSTLASGVRSSWETMLTSSVLLRSLSRSSSFCCSISSCVTSRRSAISLNARVSSPTSPGPSSGSRSESSPPAIRPAPSATARTGRPIERASTIPKSTIRAIEAPTAIAPTRTATSVRSSASRAACSASLFSSARNTAKSRRISSVCTLRLCASVASFLLSPGTSCRIGISGGMLANAYSRIWVSISCAFARWLGSSLTRAVSPASCPSILLLAS